jgi:flagellar basal-body rod protein FlgG
MQQLKFETISNNLANTNTNAFKKDVLSFDQALTLNYISETDFTPGPVRYTDNEFDVALNNRGFFKIQTSRGIRYTRDGAFSLNAEGLLVTRNGDPVLGQNGPITIRGAMSIGRDGQIVVDDAPVARLQVIDFEKPQALEKEGFACYSDQKGEGRECAAENVNVMQGYIENSNVNLTEEMIKMVEAYRAFESVQKAIQSIDEVTSKMINDYGLLR